MNSKIMKIGCALMSALTVFSMVACGGGDDSSSTPNAKKHDTETRPVVFSTDALDGNFNPFFATSATDTTIAAMTQVAMLTTDAKGNPLCGNEEPTVALAYNQTMYDADGNETDDPAEASKTNGGSTTYKFIIKNGMKFSDGEPLTIKDVLFNLYVYLDPSYMGSATIYSTDIKGLKAYRAQDPTMRDDSDVNLDTQFYAEADQRMNNLISYLDPEAGEKPEETAQITKDIATVKKLFEEEATSDWTMVAGTQESYKEEYSFTEDWEIYYFNEGLVTIQVNSATKKPLRDESGKYLTSLDLEDNPLAEEIEAVKNGENNDKPEYTLSYWVNKEGCTEAEAAEHAVREYAIDQVIEANTHPQSAIANVLRYWATGSTARDEFAAEARSDYFATISTSVESISGIKTSKTAKDFNGNDLGAEHDVLEITINGVDPKAIWNFAFSIAPMHYYSNADAIATTPFGVKFNNKEFFDTVLQDPQKNGLPVGAGTYKASKDPATSEVNKDTFYRNNWVYFERNTYFDTMGGDTITNAKIKYLRYRVVGSDKIMQALQAGNIDFGAPQATRNNIDEVGKYGDMLAYSQYATNGYGYVGVNPKFVPDIEVRQAIMKSMDTQSIVKNYYTSALAETIWRPMSKESWVWDYIDEATEFEDIAYTVNKSEIQSLVESADWELGSDGVYEKDGKKLKITFTIAGETTDHPAYEMFQDAADFLNECGFDVSVTTDITALKKLATGGLEVWAAAWSSTIDPDMYQVYHKDSKATSVKNWGYSTIFADTTGQFSDEQFIIDELSELIEQGREYLDEEDRAPIYEQALNKVMELAVELPTYQRNDLVVYNKTVINAATLNPNPSANAGVYDRLWEVDYL